MRVVRSEKKVQRKTELYVVYFGGFEYLSKLGVPTDRLADAEIYVSWREAAEVALNFDYGEVRVANLEVA